MLPRTWVRRTLAALAMIGLIGSAVGIWEGGVKYRWIPKRWGVVVPGVVFRSGQISKELVEQTFVAHDIRAVVNLCGQDNENADEVAEREVARRLGVEYQRFALKGDGTGDIRRYAEAIAVIHRHRQAGEPTLVHCGAGAQRTGGVVAVYRLLVERQSPESIRSEMMRYGWRSPGDRELVDYLNAHMEHLAGLLVANGVLDAPPLPIPQLLP